MGVGDVGSLVVGLGVGMGDVRSWVVGVEGSGVVGRVVGVGVEGSTMTSQSPHAGRQLMVIYSGLTLHSSNLAQNSQRAFKFTHSYKKCTSQDLAKVKQLRKNRGFKVVIRLQEVQEHPLF